MGAAARAGKARRAARAVDHAGRAVECRMPRNASSRPGGRARTRAPAGDTALASLFWDQPRAPDLARHRDFVVQRVLSEGGLEEIRSLRARVPDAALRKVLLRSQARGLSPQRIRFWQLLLNLPRSTADLWVRRARAGSWAKRRG